MASAYDKASLVMLPHATKDGKLYSVKPEDRSGDFTFSRGTSATRVNASGLIEKERGNLSINSQNGSAWNNSGSTINSTTAADFFGGNDAVTFTANGGGAAYVYADSAISIDSGHIYTASVYVQNVDADYVQLTFSTSGFGLVHYQNFDLTNGTLGGGLNIDANIENVGGGWYRISLTSRSTAAVSTGAIVVVIAPSASASRLQSANTGQTLTTFAIQVERGLVATDYIETTTAAVYEGVTDNLPRLDYSGGASCPSLLLESSRTNLIPYSEYVGTGYTAQNATYSINDAISPEGVSNAFKVIENTSTDVHGLYYQITSSVSTTYTISIFAKQAERTLIKLSCGGTAMTGAGGSGADQDAIFDLANGVVSNSAIGAKIETIGNDWYKCSVVVTTDSDGGSFVPYFRLVQSGTTSSYTGDGTSGAYFYGFQVEAGSYPTSYIPTYGSSVTRVGDDCNKTGISDLIGQSEGTLFAEVQIDTTSDFKHIIGVKNSGNNQRILLYVRNTNRIRFQYAGGSFDDTTITSGLYKLAISWNGSNVSFFRNGIKLLTNTNFNKTYTFSEMSLGNYLDDDQLGQGFKQALSFTTALSDAECIALTTI